MVVNIASLKTGDFFGEMSLLTGEPRSASVSALVLSLSDRFSLSLSLSHLSLSSLSLSLSLSLIVMKKPKNKIIDHIKDVNNIWVYLQKSIKFNKPIHYNINDEMIKHFQKITSNY
jgi:hypothetical protein